MHSPWNNQEARPREANTPHSPVGRLNSPQGVFAAVRVTSHVQFSGIDRVTLIVTSCECVCCSSGVWCQARPKCVIQSQ